MRASLETELRKALPLKQLQLFFQPQYDLNNHLMGAEALLRWQHPELGMVAPADFISLTEDTGLIVPMGLWILQAACQTLRSWNTLPGWEKLHISVNVSACQFSQSNFVNSVRDVVLDTGISAGNLKLELTESVFLDNVEECIDKMHILRELGIRFSMDDFGTGYSSLSYLKRLPLVELKIDQSFVHDININFDDEVIIQTIIVMGKSLGLVVIAEGVETDIQHERLLKYGCNYFQGYLFGRPQSKKDFEQLFLKLP
jgi:EAL domain-containing protein (putative c-di-GMP-specific phosphodiesterase class I)